MSGPLRALSLSLIFSGQLPLDTVNKQKQINILIARMRKEDKWPEKPTMGYRSGLIHLCICLALLCCQAQF